MQIKIVFKNCVGHVVAVHYFEGLHPLGLPILRACEYGLTVMREYHLIGYMEVFYPNGKSDGKLKLYHNG